MRSRAGTRHRSRTATTRPKLTEALVAKRYEGDIEGTSTTKWLMAYSPDKTALFVGIEHITGTIGGKKGSLVLLHDGQYREGVAAAELRVGRN